MNIYQLLNLIQYIPTMYRTLGDLIFSVNSTIYCWGLSGDSVFELLIEAIVVNDLLTTHTHTHMQVNIHAHDYYYYYVNYILLSIIIEYNNFIRQNPLKSSVVGIPVSSLSCVCRYCRHILYLLRYYLFYYNYYYFSFWAQIAKYCNYSYAYANYCNFRYLYYFVIVVPKPSLSNTCRYKL